MESSNLSPLKEEGSEGQSPSGFHPSSTRISVFHVYMAGSKGPVVFFLHGGGYSGMGGSVASLHVAATKAMANVHGLVVVDAVEGTAMASLVHMQKILSNRMQYFPTIEKAV